MAKNILKIVGFFVIGMVGGIFADQIFWPYFIERPLFHEYRLEQSPVYVTEKKEIIIQENTALREAIEKVEKTVVGVKTQTKAGKLLEGSGLIVTSDGLIVTLAELVPQGSDFSFFVEGKVVSYQILKRDLERNLALVKLGESRLPTVVFADFNKLKQGERVFLVAVGISEEDKSSSLPFTGVQVVNEGIVKSFDKDLIETNIIETDNAKGSPLFNIAGEVLGLNTLDAAGGVISLPIPQIKEFIGM